VNLSGKLTLESCQNIDGLVRFVASRRIFKRAVDQFLKDQVAIRMRAELGAFQQTAKIFDIAMKVSRNQNVRSAGQLDQVADSSGSVMKSPGGLAERFQETRRIGHGPRAQRSVRSRFAFAAVLPRCQPNIVIHRIAEKVTD